MYTNTLTAMIAQPISGFITDALTFPTTYELQAYLTFTLFMVYLVHNMILTQREEEGLDEIATKRSDSLLVSSQKVVLNHDMETKERPMTWDGETIVVPHEEEFKRLLEEPRRSNNTGGRIMSMSVKDTESL